MVPGSLFVDGLLEHVSAFGNSLQSESCISFLGLRNRPVFQVKKAKKDKAFRSRALGEV